MSLEVQSVTLGSDGGAPILQDVTLGAVPGTVTLLVGRTGSGKSSLLDVIAGLRAPTTGTVTVDGVPMWRGERPNAAALRRIGMVFQFPEHQLFARTVRGEFRYSLRPLRLDAAEIQRRMEAALAEVGLGADVLDLPPLLLSGGQRRRVALASTLATDPAWLLLDEPTAGLDPEGVRLIREVVLARRRAGRGVVIATHDWDAFAPIADQVVWLENGRVRFTGPTAEWFGALVHDGEADEVKQSGTADIGDEHERHAAAEGLGEPTGLTLWRGLLARGVCLPAIPLEPEHVAELTAAAMAASAPFEADAGVQLPSVPKAISSDMAAPRTQPDGATRVDAEPDPTTGVTPPRHPRRLSEAVMQLDPRAKWLVYMLLCVGIAMQGTWVGLAAATVVSGAFIAASGVDGRALWRVSKGLLVFMMFTAVLSGVRLALGTPDPVHFSAAAAVDTVRRLYPLWLLVTTGLALPATTSTMMMKRGLEAGLAPLRRVGIPADAVALAGALVLRFIPVILAELARFTRIARSRGKHPGNTLRPRDLPAVVLPLVLSVLELGESLSLAMEARGYVRLGQPRTHAIELRWRRMDTWAVVTGALALAVLLSVRVVTAG